MMHLPTSRLKKCPYWNYKRVSTPEQIYVDEDDTVFERIINAMSIYLRKEPIEEDVVTIDAHPHQLNPPGQHQQLELEYTKSLSQLN